MQRILCYDSDGNTINHLIQWDKNQEIYIDDLQNGIIPRVHFASQSDMTKSREYSDAVDKETLYDGRIKIKIPNSITDKDSKIFLFLYYHDGTDTSTPYTTRYVIELPVISKPFPDDYIYTDNVNWVSITNLVDEINHIKETMKQDKEELDNKKVDKEEGMGLSQNSYTDEEKDKLTNIEDEANKYVHPSYTSYTGFYKITTDEEGHVSSVNPVVKEDVTDLGVPGQDTTYEVATDTEAGLMGTEDRIKMDGIDVGAEVNQNAFSYVRILGLGELLATINADDKMGTLILDAGNNIIFTPSENPMRLVIDSKDTTYGVATTDNDGLMAAADKEKLDNSPEIVITTLKFDITGLHESINMSATEQVNCRYSYVEATYNYVGINGFASYEYRDNYIVEAYFDITNGGTSDAEYSFIIGNTTTAITLSPGHNMFSACDSVKSTPVKVFQFLETMYNQSINGSIIIKITEYN